jgi:hypothetical protein
LGHNGKHADLPAKEVEEYAKLLMFGYEANNCGTTLEGHTQRSLKYWSFNAGMNARIVLLIFKSRELRNTTRSKVKISE